MQTRSDQAERDPPACVLVVEDDRLLRHMAVELLEVEGLPTVGAASASEGLALLHTRSSLKLLITDINMPGMDGLQLLRLAERKFPRLKMLAISGRANLSVSSLPAAAEFLLKPFTASQLLARVHLVLASAGTPLRTER